MRNGIYSSDMYSPTARIQSVTGQLISACDNRSACDYTVDVKEPGDVDLGVAKAFTVSYSCGASTATKTLSIAAEANGKTVILDCKPLVGPMKMLAGRYATPVVDKVVPAASYATVTVIDDSTVLFSRDDGYKWRLGRTAALAGTNQVEIVDRTVTAARYSSGRGGAQ